MITNALQFFGGESPRDELLQLHYSMLLYCLACFAWFTDFYHSLLFRSSSFLDSHCSMYCR